MRDQKRIIASVAVIVIASLVAVGVVAYHTEHGKTVEKMANPNLLSTEAKENRFIESDGYYSLKVPPGWIADTFISKGGNSIALTSTENTEVRLGPNASSVDSGESVTVKVYKANPDLSAWEKLESDQAATNGTTMTTLTIHGQPAFLENTNSNGNQSLAYYIGHGAYIVKVSIPVTQPSANVDNTKYVSQFKSIALSLIILK